MAEVARLYYVRDLTQQQIAERLGVSRFKVLRLLEQARSEGVVRYEIDEPVPGRDDLLAPRSRGALGLATALVVESGVAAAAASLLPRLLRPARRARRLVGRDARVARQAPAGPPGRGSRRADLRRDRGAGAWHRPDGGGGALRRLGPAGASIRCRPPRSPCRMRSAGPFARRPRSSTASTSPCVGIGARTDGAGHILVHVFDDDGRIVSHERSIALSITQLRRATVVATAGGRQKRRADRGRAATRACWTSSSPTPTARRQRCDERSPSSPARAAASAARRSTAFEHAGLRRCTASTATTPFPSPRPHRRARLRARHQRPALGDGPVDACTDEGWDAVLDANLKSVFLYCQARDPAAARERRRRDRHPLVGARPRRRRRRLRDPRLRRVEGGLIGLTRAMAVAYARRRHPLQRRRAGLIATPMSARAQADERIRARLPSCSR